MMAAVGREVFDAFPGWVKVSFYTLAAVSILVFGVGAWLRARNYLKARKANRSDHLLRRIGRSVAKVTLTRSRIWRNDRFAGLAHDFLLWGFLVLLLGTLILTVDEDLYKPFLGISLLTGTTYLVYSFLLDLFGILFLLGLAMMLYRRGRRTAPRLTYSEQDRAQAIPIGRLIFDDRLFLFLLLLAGLAGFATEGIRIFRDGTSFPQEWSPVGVALAWIVGATGVGREGALAVHMGVWWLHAAGALVLIAYIPFSKAFHALAGFGSLVFSDDRAGRCLEPPASTESSGFQRISDFTWVQLMHLDACVRCGRCHDVCPAQTSGMPLSPRGIILQLRSFVAGFKGDGGTSVVGNAVEAEAIWSCATCLACMEACPLQIEHIPLIVEMRRYLVARGEMDKGLQEALTSLGRYGNSFRKPARDRAKWTKRVSFKIKDATREPVEYLWFVGDYASLDARCQEMAARTAEVFSKMALDFGILGEGERNAGNDVRRVGEEGLFEVLRDSNTELMKACKFRDIVTTDPHTYNTLKNEYPPLNGGRVLHYTELFEELLRSGRLRFSKKLPYRVTYHDPCYLGRYNGVFDAPRDLLKAMGVEILEMPRNRSNSFCCGAGGGRTWMEEGERRGERAAEIRVAEASRLDGVDTLVVACPKDYVMFTDAVKAAGLEGSLRIRDISDLVEEAL
ncbi:MAG: hypothetical protein A3K68_07110 [Euryarchaeota archaeon RBG_16_68_13]|nr:MAG: hypothetical protein A3K68_07110 [Euryarchaeota archaeon RBG_16_68_13]